MIGHEVIRAAAVDLSPGFRIWRFVSFRVDATVVVDPAADDYFDDRCSGYWDCRGVGRIEC